MILDVHILRGDFLLFKMKTVFHSTWRCLSCFRYFEAIKWQVWERLKHEKHWITDDMAEAQYDTVLMLLNKQDFCLRYKNVSYY